MRKLLLSAALVLGAALPAVACINDSDTGGSEREFRSRYQQEAEDSESLSVPEDLIQATSGGLLLLLGGYIVRRRLSA